MSWLTRMVESGRAWRSARTTAGVTLRARPLSSAAKAVPMRRACNRRITPAQGNGLEPSIRGQEPPMSAEQSTVQKIALVTGSASGMGRTIALALKAHGYSVFGTSRQAGKALPADYPLVPLDVLSDASVRSAVETVRERAGRIDVLVNNVGSRLLGAVEETSV